MVWLGPDAQALEDNVYRNNAYGAFHFSFPCYFFRLIWNQLLILISPYKTDRPFISSSNSLPERQTDRQNHKQIEPQTDRQTDKQTDRKTDRQTERQIYVLLVLLNAKEKDRQTDGRTDRQAKLIGKQIGLKIRLCLLTLSHIRQNVKKNNNN